MLGIDTSGCLTSLRPGMVLQDQVFSKVNFCLVVQCEHFAGLMDFGYNVLEPVEHDKRKEGSQPLVASVTEQQL